MANNSKNIKKIAKESSSSLIDKYSITDGAKGRYFTRRIFYLYPSQFRFLLSNKQEVLMSGGYGCVVGSTKLLTKDGEVEIEELVKQNKAPEVLTFTGKDFKWIQAEVPYLKSHEETLEIKTSDGKLIEVAKNHYFLTMDGWKPASSCVVGEQLLAYSSFPQASNSEFSQLIRRKDVSRWIHKDVNSQFDYLEHLRLYDEQPLSLLDNDQCIFPLLNDAHEHNRWNLQEDVVADELKYKRPSQYVSRFSKQDLKTQSYFSSYQQQYDSYKETYEDVPQYSYSKSDYNGRQFVSESYHPYTSEYTYLNRYAKDISDSKDYNQLASFDQAFYQRSYISPYLTTSIIQEINHNRCTKIYDIGVPVYHNYVANGLIHHNSGKTFILCLKVLCEALKPGNIVILARKYYGDLKNSTLRTLLEGDGSQPPVIPPGCYNYNVLDKRIDIIGGGTIYLVGFDDPKKIGSINAGFVGIDEAWQIDEAEYMSLQKRLRNDIGCRQIMMVTNPGTYGHFLYRKFYTDGRNEKNMEAIEAYSEENVNLPQDYIDGFLKNQCSTKTEIDNIMHGKWVSVGSLVYPQWDKSKLIERDVKDFEYFYCPVDYGYAGKMAMLLAGLDKDNNIHIFDEFYKSKALHVDVISQIEQWKQFQPDVIVDPSAAGFIAELQDREINAVKADNIVDVGIGRMRNYLATGKLTADPKCKNFVEEVENYSFGEDGKPIKKHDHLMDCCRYLCNHVAVNMAPIKIPRIYGYSDYLSREEGKANSHNDMDRVLELRSHNSLEIGDIYADFI